MGLFSSKKDKTGGVSRISVFPKIGSVVLKKDDKLVVFNPRYLLGKHSSTSEQVASKFMNLNTASRLLELIDRYVRSGNLSGPKVEIKEVDFGFDVGFDSLVELTPKLLSVVPAESIGIEDVRGNRIKVINAAKANIRIPATRLLNIILVPFNPQYGDGVDQFFKEKYKWVGFEDFKAVYAVLTIYPGKHAPPMNDSSFWSRHALLR